MMDFKKGSLLVVQEDNVVIKGCFDSELGSATLDVKEGPMGYPPKKQVIQHIKEKGYTPVFHKKGSIFSCEEFVFRAENDTDRRMVRIKGIYYYAGFFKLLDKNVKRRSIFK